MEGLFGPRGQNESPSINRSVGNSLQKDAETVKARQQPIDAMLGELQGAQSPKGDGQGGARTSPGKQQTVATPPQHVQTSGRQKTSAKPCKPTVSVPADC